MTKAGGEKNPKGEMPTLRRGARNRKDNPFIERYAPPDSTANANDGTMPNEAFVTLWRKHLLCTPGCSFVAVRVSWGILVVDT